MGLRKTEGISVLEFQIRFQLDFYELYYDVVHGLIKNELLAEDKKHGRIYLTKRGIDVSNVVLAEFLLNE